MGIDGQDGLDGLDGLDGRATSLAPGDQVSLSVTPDRYVTVRYAGASGDFNPIHIDEQFALEVGLPGRILHGLWSMAQVARAVGAATGDDPSALKSLSVQFRGMGAIGEEIIVSGTVGDVSDGVATVKLDAVQGTTKVIKGAVAELRVP
jgi:acyl dehydratase